MFGNSFLMEGKALDYLWKKQEVILNNISNVDTPGYKKKQVRFVEEFKNRLKAASQTHDRSAIRQAIQDSNYQVYTAYDSSARVDENNVNADVENVEMARTGLHYQYMLQSVTNDFKRYQSAIKGQ